MSVTLKGRDLLEDLIAGTPLESADRFKRRVFKAGETLQGIAAEEYEDPGHWRALARANDIDNPLTIPVGRAMSIPPLT